VAAESYEVITHNRPEGLKPSGLFLRDAAIPNLKPFATDLNEKKSVDIREIGG
jgi:hypothetical protein